MFTRLIVGNFKAIRETVEIDLRPITLLFGPNAAGKSSVLHAIHYLAELLRGGPRDVHKTTLSGGLLDLGGFDNVVHGRDPMGRVTLGIEYEASADSEPSIVDPDHFLADGGDPAAQGDAADRLRCAIRCYRIAVTIGRASTNATPTVLAVEIELNHEPLAVLAAAVGVPVRVEARSSSPVVG